jgi:branched-chain amino acid transport system substrate-binding protein
MVKMTWWLGWCWLLVSTALGATEPILVGQTADFSGVAGAQMRDFNAGANLVLGQVNQHGGVQGRAIKLLSLDDGLTAERAARNARQLIAQDHVIALFGTRGTDPSAAALKVAEAAGVPIVAPVTGSDLVRQSPLVFPVRTHYRNEIDHMLRHMSLVPTRLAVLVQDDHFGRPLAGYIAEEVSARHKSIALVAQAYFERLSTDMKDKAAAILASRPQAVIALCNPGSCAAFVAELTRQVKASGQPYPRLYQTSISDIYGQFRELGPDIVAGQTYSQILPDPRRTLSHLSREFGEAASMGQVAPTYRAFEGYVAAKVLVKGLQRAPSLSPAGLVRGLESLGRIDLGGLYLRYEPGLHEGCTYVELVSMDERGQIRR